MKNSYSMDAHPYPWDYNPSSWSQRIRVAFLAFIALIIAIYLGLYQWQLIDNVWDPIFGEQSARVLTSDVSHQMTEWIRIPDAILGAWAYLGDLVFALAGSTRRWQFRPWLVLLFGLDVIPLGIVGAILVILQGVVIGSWCFLCIISAVISLILVVLAYDEVFTSYIYLYRVWKKTRNLKILWKTFCGTPSEEANEIANNMVR
ncbi:MAG: vitamin K epoxide reductase [Parachlamydiaceae bacterium]|nr:vitamin K epoxide reductase [Parachlamydiaceae bacterium]